MSSKTKYPFLSNVATSCQIAASPDDFQFLTSHCDLPQSEPDPKKIEASIVSWLKNTLPRVKEVAGNLCKEQKLAKPSVDLNEPKSLFDPTSDISSSLLRLVLMSLLSPKCHETIVGCLNYVAEGGHCLPQKQTITSTEKASHDWVRAYVMSITGGVRHSCSFTKKDKQTSTRVETDDQFISSQFLLELCYMSSVIVRTSEFFQMIGANAKHLDCLPSSPKNDDVASLCTIVFFQLTKKRKPSISLHRPMSNWLSHDELTDPSLKAWDILALMSNVDVFKSLRQKNQVKKEQTTQKQQVKKEPTLQKHQAKKGQVASKESHTNHAKSPKDEPSRHETQAKKEHKPKVTSKEPPTNYAKSLKPSQQGVAKVPEEICHDLNKLKTLYKPIRQKDSKNKGKGPLTPSDHFASAKKKAEELGLTDGHYPAYMVVLMQLSQTMLKPKDFAKRFDDSGAEKIVKILRRSFGIARKHKDNDQTKWLNVMFDDLSTNLFEGGLAKTLLNLDQFDKWDWRRVMKDVEVDNPTGREDEERLVGGANNCTKKVEAKKPHNARGKGPDPSGPKRRKDIRAKAPPEKETKKPHKAAENTPKKNPARVMAKKQKSALNSKSEAAPSQPVSAAKADELEDLVDTPSPGNKRNKRKKLVRSKNPTSRGTSRTNTNSPSRRSKRTRTNSSPKYT